MMDESKDNNSNYPSHSKDSPSIDSNQEILEDKKFTRKVLNNNHKTARSKGLDSTSRMEKGDKIKKFSEKKQDDESCCSDNRDLNNKDTHWSKVKKNASKIYPTHEEDSLYQKNIQLNKHFILMSKEELFQQGIKGWRYSLSCMFKDLGIGIFILAVSLVYGVYTLVWLAIEPDIFDSNEATLALQILELAFLIFFAVEIIIYTIAYGPKLYFRYYLNLADFILISTLLIWDVLDIIDSKIFRTKGAYRVIRVCLLFLRLRFELVTNHLRNKANNSYYDSKSPFEQVFDILANVRDLWNDPKLKSDMNYCIDMITSGKIFSRNQRRITDDLKFESDGLSWARNNSEIVKKESFESRKQIIIEKAQKLDVYKKFNLDWKTIAQLEKVQEFDFDIFKVNRETNGNGMIITSMYLFSKHSLYESLCIDPRTFEIFISSIQEGYNDIAYHNKIHGMDVGRSAYYYSTTWDMMKIAQLDDKDLATLIVGGAIHDFEHLGWNNAYLIETQHDWAVTYNDISVWENHHVAAAFNVIKNKPGWNIFENMCLEEFKNIRK
jgi:hypothetical protein